MITLIIHKIYLKDILKLIDYGTIQNQERIFERFVKVDEFVPGTGLGLSICRSLAASLDGRVGVVSELGKGSTFWVELGKDIIVYESN